MACDDVQKQIVALTVRLAPPDVAKRRDACRRCRFATKNPDPRYEKFEGLTDASACLAVKTDEKPGNIALGTLMPKAECPFGAWSSAAFGPPSPFGGE